MAILPKSELIIKPELYKCGFCGGTCRPKELSKNWDSHKIIGTYECDICGATFTDEVEVYIKT